MHRNMMTDLCQKGMRKMKRLVGASGRNLLRLSSCRRTTRARHRLAGLASWLGRSTVRILTFRALHETPDAQRKNSTFVELCFLCVGQDSNLRRPKSLGLQPSAFDHSATDAAPTVCRIFAHATIFAWFGYGQWRYLLHSRHFWHPHWH